MASSALKSVEAIHNGRKISGLYRRQTGTFEAKKGAVKIIVPEYEYWFDFTVAGKRYRSVFGKESDFGRVGATGKWVSHAVESAVEALVRIPAASDHQFRCKLGHPFRSQLDQAFRCKLGHRF
ncbi:hypothetical protein [Syntrophotalea acetylenica]|uniref:hypothetical protein n=1 Tax=Syntrophotalea acetylenica TaxID=29542 RepID=UPI002A35B46D|nr:hypothetical protein [Syntrophotalea acetylenica]MDY0263162.1 hypothetical protein [Syntrophotalea acetylenica]